MYQGEYFMIHTTNLRIIAIRNAFKKFRGLVNLSIVTLAALGFIYLVYWAAVMSDDMMLEYSKYLFSPLATAFFPNETTLEIYRMTSFALFALIIPVGALYYVADKIEEALINKERKIEKTLEENKLKQQAIDNLMQYEIINNYSICLSLDYESKRTITDETKKVLNNIAFSKIKKILQNAPGNIKVSSTDILIVTSSDFEKYDVIYGAILRILAKIKSTFERKYDLKMVANIISDAYTNPESTNKIERNHKDFENLNFKNRALTTATFSKKYKYLNHNKYAGIPIGEYASFKGNRMRSWELNIVFKNLEQTLASIT